MKTYQSFFVLITSILAFVSINGCEDPVDTQGQLRYIHAAIHHMPTTRVDTLKSGKLFYVTKYTDDILSVKHFSSDSVRAHVCRITLRTKNGAVFFEQHHLGMNRLYFRRLLRQYEAAGISEKDISLALSAAIKGLKNQKYID